MRRLRALPAVLTLGAGLPLLAAAPAQEPAKSALAPRHRMLLVAARDLAAEVCPRVWPGWSGADMEVLLIAGESELLVGGSRRPGGFEGAGEILGTAEVWARPRVLPPTLLATMPLFGPPPTIVVGTPEATGRSGSAWLQVLLHEHFHQWQMRGPGYYEAVARLDLAGGDTTGRWMLEYAFPYGDGEVGRRYEALSRRLAELLRRPAEEDLGADSGAFWAAYRRLVDSLPAADGRYLEFQLWQEGVARFVELRVAEEAAAHWQHPAALAAESDSPGFGVLAAATRNDLLAELDAPDLAGRRRVSFYALGAGMALLLERTQPAWKERYDETRFALAPAPAFD